MSTDDPMRGAHPDEPLPHAGTVAGTPDGNSGRAFAIPEPALVTVPGYEVFGELGRGAMGVVYKARQVKLNRVVALKMVLGEKAAAKDLIRFLAEAEAVAAIKHQNVVQVYEYGVAPGPNTTTPDADDHTGFRENGRPYLALEFLSGGSLSDRLASAGGAPMPADDAAALITVLARGAAAAHALGIVHRDLKPANILFDRDGTPKVTDFGIAKRIDRSTGATTGGIVGTPAYMSPEQAAGDATFVGPPADVWALGGILYECLTGTRPFTGNFLKLVVRIAMDDPVPPRELVATVPRDLEMICLKCLAKSPNDRYPTARELADDLDRFARGEPIGARPVGPVERGYKWTRRNKAVAGAMVAVALALLVGSVVSVGFGWEAQKQANRASGEAVRADRERDDALRARGESQRANAQLSRARDDLQNLNDALESALAKSLLGPIRAERRDDPLTPYEAEAFWELAQRRTRVNRQFLNAATRNPLATKQLECRVEFALHAAIGLDLELLDLAEQLLIERLNDPGTPAAQRVSLALACSRWEQSLPATTATAAAALSDALAGTTDPVAQYTISRGLVALASRMPPDAATKTLTEAMTRTKHPYALRIFVECLTAAIAKLPPDRATGPNRDAAKVLADAITETKDGYALAELATALVLVTAGTATEDTARVLTAAMNRTNDRFAMRALASALDVVATELIPAAAASARGEAKQILINLLVMNKESDATTLLPLIEGLIAVARSDADESATLTKIIVDAMVRATAPDDLKQLVRCVRALAPRVEPYKAAPLVKDLADAIGRGGNPATLSALGVALATMAARTGPEFTADHVGAAMGRTKNPSGLTILADILIDFGAGGRPERTVALAAAAERIFSAELNTTRNPDDLRQLAVGLTVVAARMEPGRASAVRTATAKTLTAAMAAAPSHDLKALGSGLVIVTASMGGDEANALRDGAAQAVAEKLAGVTDLAEKRVLAEGLAVVARKLDPAQAATVGKALASVVTRTKNEHDREAAATRLKAVLAQMRNEDALRVVTDAIAETEDSRALHYLAVQFAAYSGRPEASAASAAIAKKLRGKIAIAQDPQELADLINALAIVVTSSEPNRVALAEELLNAVGQTRDRDALGTIAHCLTAVAFGVSPVELESMRNAALLTPGTGCPPRGVLAALPLVRGQLLLVPRPLPPQALVELLKHPLCVGEARRAVLEALAFTYHRPFADLWAFVDFAKKHQPQLDLLTPPRRR